MSEKKILRNPRYRFGFARMMNVLFVMGWTITKRLRPHGGDDGVVGIA